MERGFRPGSFSYIRFLGELSGASENSSSCSSAHAARWTHAANVSFYKLVARTVLVHQTAAPKTLKLSGHLSVKSPSRQLCSFISTESRLYSKLPKNQNELNRSMSALPCSR